MDYDHELRSPSFKSSPSSWIRSKALDLPDDIRFKFAGFFSKIGKSGRRQCSTSEFRYDPASYALNFEDEASRPDEFPVWRFSAGLPLSTASSGEGFPASVSTQMASCS